MRAEVGVAVPAEVATVVALLIARGSTMREAVRGLHAGGYTTASSLTWGRWRRTSVVNLQRVRARIRLRPRGRWKSGPHYYRAISEDIGIDPRRAVCVDDTPVVLDWAKKVGMRTFLLGGQGGGQRHERIASLMELEPLI